MQTSALGFFALLVLTGLASCDGAIPPEASRPETGGAASSGGAVGAGGSASNTTAGVGGTSTSVSSGTGGVAAGGVATGGSAPGGSGGQSAAGSAGSLAGGGNGGSSGSGGGVVVVSGLPVPSTGPVAKPSGSPGGLEVLDWAGFKAAVTYTLDDSQPSQIEHYAELQATGVPMTFYVNSGRNAEANYDSTWTQAVADGHEIGNHTAHHCHANLTECAGTSSGSKEAEIDECSSYIEQHFGQGDVWTMASPFGDTGWDATAATRFFLNRGVGPGTVAPNSDADEFNLPVHLAASGESTSSFNTAIDGVHTSGQWLIFLIHTISPTSANWYNPIDISTVTGSVTHAKSLGDVWIDTLVQVGAYWRAQNVLSNVTPSTSGSDSTWAWTLPEHFPSGKYLRITVTGGTVKQNGAAIAWDEHGYYEVALDAGSLTISP